MAEVHPSDKKNLGRPSCISFSSSSPFSRYMKRKSFLKGLGKPRVYIPYQVIPINFWMTQHDVTIMIRNMEPFFHWNYRYTTNSRLRNIALYLLSRVSLLRCNRVICVGQHVADRIGPFLSRKPHAIIPHGVDVPTSSSAKNTECGLALIVGSGLPYRGLEDVLLLKNNKILNYFRFQWSGSFLDTKYKAKIRSLKKNTHINFTELGHIPLDQVLDCMRRCEIYIATSQVEACPNTALEAMSVGALIIASDTPAHREFLPPSTMFYEPGNPDSLESCLLTVRNREVPRKVKLTTWSETMEKTLDFILHGLH